MKTIKRIGALLLAVALTLLQAKVIAPFLLQHHSSAAFKLTMFVWLALVAFWFWALLARFES